MLAEGTGDIHTALQLADEAVALDEKAIATGPGCPFFADTSSAA